MHSHLVAGVCGLRCVSTRYCTHNNNHCHVKMGDFDGYLLSTCVLRITSGCLLHGVLLQLLDKSFSLMKPEAGFEFTYMASHIAEKDLRF